MKSTAGIFAALLAVLTVGPAALSARAIIVQETVAEKSAGGVDKAKDAIVDASKTVAGKTKAGLSKTGEVITDGWVTSRIHEQFITVDLLKDSDINVDTSKRVVTLKGTVMTRAGRTKAVSVARDTEGVRRVINKLTIGPKITN